MKLYITGGVGSGKSTLARRLSRITGIPCHALDEVVYAPAPDDPDGNARRPAPEIEALFDGILAQPDWLIEDAGRELFARGMAQADAVVLLDIHPLRRRWRIVKRFARQKLGMEPSVYRPSLSMLRRMFKWARDRESGRDGLRERIARNAPRVITLRTPREIDAFCRAADAGDISAWTAAARRGSARPA